MTRFYLIFIFLNILGNLSAYSDCGDSIVVEIHNVITLRSSYKYVSVFDANGNKKSYTSYKLQNNIWKNHFREISQRDSLGRLLLHLNQTGNNFSWDTSQLELLFYNFHGDLDSNILQYNGSTNDSYTINKYDSAYNLIEHASFKWNNQIWNNYSRDLYYYDQNGDDTLMLTFRGSLNNWTPDYRIHKAYDSFHNLLFLSKDSYDGTQWIPFFSENYSYKNGLIDSTLTAYNGSTQYKFLTVVIYDSLNRLSSRNQYIWNGSEWGTPDLSDSIAYDSSGHIIYFQDPTEHFTYIYNSSGQLIDESGGTLTSSGYSNQYFYINNILDHENSRSYTRSGEVFLSYSNYYYSEIFGNQISCNGANVLLTTDTCSSYSYRWSNGATTSSIEAHRGDYSVTVTHPNGASYISTPFEIVSVTSRNAFLGNDTLICLPSELNLSPGNFTTYLWNDSSINSQFVAHSANADTLTYYVLVSDTNSCQSSDTINIIFDACLSIDKHFPNLFSIYPNPTSSITNIHLISQESGQLLLYNLNGQIIKNISFQNISNIELNIADLENGIYHLQLITLKKTFNSKIIKN